MLRACPKIIGIRHSMPTYLTSRQADHAEMQAGMPDCAIYWRVSYLSGISNKSSFETPFHNPIMPADSACSTLVIF